MTTVGDQGSTTGSAPKGPPSGIGYAGFTLGIAGIIVPGVPFVALPLSGAALHLDARAGRRRWAAAWGIGLSIAGLVTDFELVLHLLDAAT